MVTFAQGVKGLSWESVVRDSFGFEEVSIGGRSSRLHCLPLSWPGITSLSKFMLNRCEAPLSRVSSCYGNDWLAGFVYAAIFPGEGVVKFGSTHQCSPARRLSGLRHANKLRDRGEPALSKDECVVAAIIPALHARALERRVLHAVWISNHDAYVDGWRPRRSDIPCGPGCRIRDSKTCEYFHDAPGTIRAVRWMREAMNVCVSRRVLWDSAGYLIDHLEGAVAEQGAWRGENSCSSA